MSTEAYPCCKRAYHMDFCGIKKILHCYLNNPFLLSFQTAPLVQIYINGSVLDWLANMLSQYANTLITLPSLYLAIF